MLISPLIRLPVPIVNLSRAHSSTQSELDKGSASEPDLLDAPHKQYLFLSQTMNSWRLDCSIASKTDRDEEWAKMKTHYSNPSLPRDRTGYKVLEPSWTGSTSSNSDESRHTSLANSKVRPVPSNTQFHLRTRRPLDTNNSSGQNRSRHNYNHAARNKESVLGKNTLREHHR